MFMSDRVFLDSVLECGKFLECFPFCFIFPHVVNSAAEHCVDRLCIFPKSLDEDLCEVSHPRSHHRFYLEVDWRDESSDFPEIDESAARKEDFGAAGDLHWMDQVANEAVVRVEAILYRQFSIVLVAVVVVPDLRGSWHPAAQARGITVPETRSRPGNVVVSVPERMPWWGWRHYTEPLWEQTWPPFGFCFVKLGCVYSCTCGPACGSATSGEGLEGGGRLGRGGNMYRYMSLQIFHLAALFQFPLPQSEFAGC